MIRRELFENGSGQKRPIKKKARRFAGILAIIFGLGLFLYPDVKTWYLERQTAAMVSEFRKQNPAEEQLPDSGGGSGYEILQATEGLWDAVREYNDRIFADGQAGFQDAWNFTQAPGVLYGMDDGIFGYIEIPAMDVTLPLYLGASTEHMAKGAAVLGETSIPVGGANTNSVIAGHRGYRGAPYFRDIEDLSIGDAVYITNPWETLTYRVESIDIIDPDDSDAVKIQEGKDMATLLTCHPYRSHGKYRYAVYCVRDESPVADDPVQGGAARYIAASDGGMYASSRDDIRTEERARRCAAAAILFIVGFTFLANRHRKGREIESQ